MHIPDYLIIDEIRRREQDKKRWEPEPLHLPLEAPRQPYRSEDEDTDDEESPRVIIIQM